MTGGKGSDSLSSEPDCLIILVFILWDLCPTFLLIPNLDRKEVVTFLILQTEVDVT